MQLYEANKHHVTWWQTQVVYVCHCVVHLIHSKTNIRLFYSVQLKIILFIKGRVRMARIQNYFQALNDHFLCCRFLRPRQFLSYHFWTAKQREKFIALDNEERAEHRCSIINFINKKTKKPGNTEHQLLHKITTRVRIYLLIPFILRGFVGRFHASPTIFQPPQLLFYYIHLISDSF